MKRLPKIYKNDNFNVIYLLKMIKVAYNPRKKNLGAMVWAIYGPYVAPAPHPNMGHSYST